MAKAVDWHRLVSLERGIKENHLIIMQEYPNVSYGAVKKVVQRKRKKLQSPSSQYTELSRSHVADGELPELIGTSTVQRIEKVQANQTYDEWAKCHSGYSWFARVPEWIADKYGYVMEVVGMKRYSLRS